MAVSIALLASALAIASGEPSAGPQPPPWLLQGGEAQVTEMHSSPGSPSVELRYRIRISPSPTGSGHVLSMGDLQSVLVGLQPAAPELVERVASTMPRELSIDEHGRAIAGDSSRWNHWNCALDGASAKPGSSKLTEREIETPSGALVARTTTRRREQSNYMRGLEMYETETAFEPTQYELPPLDAMIANARNARAESLSAGEGSADRSAPRLDACEAHLEPGESRPIRVTYVQTFAGGGMQPRSGVPERRTTYWLRWEAEGSAGGAGATPGDAESTEIASGAMVAPPDPPPSIAPIGISPECWRSSPTALLPAPADRGLPAPAYCAAPRYPSAALRKRQQGTAQVEAQFDASGRVVATRIYRSSGHALLDEAALSGVRAWRFHPALEAGVPVAGNAVVPIMFSFVE